MKTYSFRLTEEEQEIIDVVSKNSQYRQFKDPKAIYISSAMEALKKLAK
jgi:predicted DNA-binding protein